MILIKNAKIYTMAEEVLENSSILIEDGKIKEIGDNINISEDMEIIDAEGRMMTPGFVDAHCHVGAMEDSIGFEGNDVNEMVNPITPTMNIADGINPMDITFKEAYEAGITTAHIAPGSANVIGGASIVAKTYGNRIDDMIIKNPAAMKVAFGENPKRVYKEQKKSPTTRMATAALLREMLFKTERYIEEKRAGKDVYDADLEALVPVIKREIPLKAHAHRADDIFTAIRIAKEFDLELTLDHCTDGSSIKEYLAEEGYPALVGPTFGHRSKYELMNQSYKTVKDLVDLGVKVSVITDSPIIPLRHLPLAAGLAMKEGMTEIEALETITINPAIASGVGERVGSLEIGKDADLVVFDGNPLRDVNHKVFLTMIDGEIVYRQ